jgi:hypothetical protein
MIFPGLGSLDDHDIGIVTDVVRRWCEDHQVEIDSAEGRAAMAAAVDRMLSGEQSPVALSEAINASWHGPDGPSMTKI